MAVRLSRRDFLQRSAGALAALTVPVARDEPIVRLPWDLPLPLEDLYYQSEQPLGRVTASRLRLREEPDRNAPVTGYRRYDDVITIHGTAEGPGEMAHNPVWFKTVGGFAHSSFVQPVKKRLNRPLLPSEVSEETPVLLEVTMPYSDAYGQAAVSNWRVYRLYCATTHWAVSAEIDESRRSWYKLRNDRGHGYYYARAEHLRPVSSSQLAPIAPGAEGKRIEIKLSEQLLTAYEGEKVVMSARVSTGAVFSSDDGVDRDFRTPVGTYRVLRKRASRHMEGGTRGIDFFDLPGIPWVTYFTWRGIALHGTYWHNDYGRQRSHGCVNLTPEDARWLYLWTEPAVPPSEEVLEAPAAAGTPIRVFW
jgi:lipoprotein-anchoring transpeptidase ErfK/SrfK